MQAQPDQHQQQAEAQRGASHMCQAGTQAMAGTAAQRNDVDRAGEIEAASAKAAMDRDRLMRGSVWLR